MVTDWIPPLVRKKIIKKIKYQRELLWQKSKRSACWELRESSERCLVFGQNYWLFLSDWCSGCMVCAPNAQEGHQQRLWQKREEIIIIYKVAWSYPNNDVMSRNHENWSFQTSTCYDVTEEYMNMYQRLDFLAWSLLEKKRGKIFIYTILYNTPATHLGSLIAS